MPDSLSVYRRLVWEQEAELKKLRKFQADWRATVLEMRFAMMVTAQLYESLDVLADDWRKDGCPGSFSEYISGASSRGHLMDQLETVESELTRVTNSLEAKKD